MSRKYRQFIILISAWVLLSISQLAHADQTCQSIDGRKSYTIKWSTINTFLTPDQSVTVYKKNNKQLDLWSMYNQSVDSDVVFLEENLELFNWRNTYDLVITYNKDSQEFTYYRKKRTDTDWKQIASFENDAAHTNKVDITFSHADYDFLGWGWDVSCSEGIDAPIATYEFPQLCEYFPEPAQSWKSTSNLNLQNKTTISGWSDSYIQQYFDSTSDTLAIGFDSLSWHATQPNTCELGGCRAGGQKAPVPEVVSPGWASGELTINSSNYSSVCESNRFCEYESNSNKTHIRILSSLDKLDVRGYNGKSFTIELVKKTGPYGLKIRDYNVGGNVNTILQGDSEYTFGSWVLVSQTPEVSVESNVIINITDEYRQENPVKFTDLEGTRDLIIYGPNADITLKNQNNNDVFAQILANTLTLSNKVKIRGAVTTNSLYSSSSGTEIIGEGHCLDSSPIDYALVVSPVSGSGIACDGIPIDFTLVDENTGLPVIGSDQTLYVVSEAVGNKNQGACWSDDGNITTSECTQSDGTYSDQFSAGESATVRQFIHSKFLNDYMITAFVNGNEIDVTTGPYSFVAEALSILPSNGVDGSDDNQVAGRPFPFRIMVKGKQNGNGNQLKCTVVDHDGSFDLDFSHTRLPETSSENLKISTDGGDSWQDADQALTIEFKDGVAGGNENSADNSLQALWHDAGITELTIASSSDALPSSVSDLFYFRPFTMSICALSGSLPNYTDQQNGKFVPSGSDFDGYIRAVNWLDTLDENNNGIPNASVRASDICHLGRTSSYYSHNGFPAVASFAPQSVSYPSSSGVSEGNVLVNGQVIAGSQVELLYGQQTTPIILNWNEVGTLSLSASQNSYLNRAGFDIPATPAEIGRFYPEKLVMIPESEPWTYASNHTGFAYMGQEIGHSFKVEAQNLNDEPTVNYGLFDTELIVDLRYTATETTSNTSLVDRIAADSAGQWSGGEWLGPLWENGNSARLEVDLTDFSFGKKAVIHSSNNYTSQVDGPYDETNVTFGLEITSSPDDVAFEAESGTCEAPCYDAEFSEKPDFRYGRMNMLDVGAVTGTSDLAVPLRTEFWDGQRFVINQEDSGSIFNSDYYCTQTIWRSDELTRSDVEPSGEGEVISGESDGFSVSQLPSSSGLREQARVWLRINTLPPTELLGENSIDCQSVSTSVVQPWLRFNWRDNGDEDPSSVITFGVHRGNDRVIYRGEPGL